MKYEVSIDENQWCVSIERKGDQVYAVTLGDGPTQLIRSESISPGVRSILHQGRSFDVTQAETSDGFELELRGERYIADVVDPRKKALNMGGGLGGDKVVTRMPGRVIAVNVSIDDAVKKGDIVCVIEAMKMENPFKSPRDGVIASVNIEVGDLVEAKQVLISLS